MMARDIKFNLEKKQKEIKCCIKSKGKRKVLSEKLEETKHSWVELKYTRNYKGLYTIFYLSVYLNMFLLQ